MLTPQSSPSSGSMLLPSPPYRLLMRTGAAHPPRNKHGPADPWNCHVTPNNHQISWQLWLDIEVAHYHCPFVDYWFWNIPDDLPATPLDSDLHSPVQLYLSPLLLWNTFSGEKTFKPVTTLLLFSILKFNPHNKLIIYNCSPPLGCKL